MNKLQGGDEVSLDIQSDGALVLHPEYEYTSKQDEVILPINANDDLAVPGHGQHMPTVAASNDQPFACSTG